VKLAGVTLKNGRRGISPLGNDDSFLHVIDFDRRCRSQIVIADRCGSKNGLKKNFQKMIAGGLEKDKD
jgi:hypothetical protein